MSLRGAARRHAVGIALCVFGSARPLAAEPGTVAAAAQEAPPPVRFDVTEATTLLYGWDNRDYAPNQVASVVNDDWGVWYNRLNVQATSGAFRFGLRLDNAWFFAAPDPEGAADELLARRPADSAGVPAPAYRRAKALEAGRELSNRYINWLYPAKYYAGFERRDLQLTVGDLYAELGYGLVLSVRKRDELASDDSIRGGRIAFRVRTRPLDITFTALGGALNPLRIDEATGRYLGVDSSVTPGLLTLTEAGMPRAVETDFVSDGGDCRSFATCSYAPDRVVAAQLGFELGGFKLSTQGSAILRQPALSSDTVRSADTITTISQLAEVMSSDGKGALALEAATQKLAQNDGEAELPRGHAVYATGSYAFSDVVLLVEAKHYRRFFPLRANVSVARAREYSLLAWNAPPTTEAAYIDTEFDGANTCVSGGRGRADVKLAPGVSGFGWLGYWETFAETVSNDRCVVDAAHRNRVFDVASGFELRSRDAASRGTLSAGARFDDTDAPLSTPYGPSHAFYRELYTRYDVVRSLGGPLTLELKGHHRRRRRTYGGPLQPWFEGEHATGLAVGSQWAFSVGVEYDTNPQPPDAFLNGVVKYRPTPSSAVSLFAGQRRGSLRCEGGVCRVVPGFEGMRLDASVNF